MNQRKTSSLGIQFAQILELSRSMKTRTAAVLCAVLCVLPCAAQRVEPLSHQTLQTPKGMPLPLAAVANKVTEPLPGKMTTQDFQARLRAGGIVTLSGGDLTLGSPDYRNDNVVYMALDTLELRNGARIVTNGNTLILFLNHLVSEDGAIVTFNAGNGTASGGGAGTAGAPGVPGRVAAVHVIQDVKGILHVDLSGQNGGVGGNGTQGSPGQPGVKGDQSVSGMFDCSKGGGNGSPGATGGIGGTGGDGGAGGAGGLFELYNVGPAPIPTVSYSFVARAGSGGSPGIGGPGGPGGHGGDGGDGSRNCNGGHPGANGATGPNGPNGQTGPTPNAGSAVVKNLDLEFILGTELGNIAKLSSK
jgi:hypothetical protein